MAIGIFDSGVGGLSIWTELRKRLKTRLIYFGDTAHVPYGEKTSSQLEGYFWNIMEFFTRKKCIGTVVACNTSSALVLPRAAAQAKMPVLGIIEAAVQSVLAAGGSRIGILATRATVESGVYQQQLQRVRPEWEIFAQSAPRLVPLVESGKIEAKETEKALREYLAPLQAEKIDTLLLACTHYSFLLPLLRRIAGPGVQVVDPAPAVGRRAELLWEQLIQSDPENRGSEFWVSANPGEFQRTAEKLLNEKIPAVGLYDKLGESR